MNNSISVGRTVAVFLALHTAMILMLAFLVVHGAAPSVNMFTIIGIILLALAATLYTAYRISQSIKDQIQGSAKALDNYSKQLHSKALDLEDYAAELKKWASDMQEQQQRLARRVDSINKYGKRLTELVEAMDKAEDQEPRFSSAS